LKIVERKIMRSEKAAEANLETWKKLGEEPQ
jgi:hypothetical protein